VKSRFAKLRGVAVMRRAKRASAAHSDNIIRLVQREESVELDCQRNSRAITSAGVSNPSVSCGRPLSRSAVEPVSR
jgi:hypothetical protein